MDSALGILQIQYALAHRIPAVTLPALLRHLRYAFTISQGILNAALGVKLVLASHKALPRSVLQPARVQIPHHLRVLWATLTR
jgi:hypothetical protein